MSLKPIILQQFCFVYKLIIQHDSISFLEENISEFVRKKRSSQEELINLISDIAKEYINNNEHNSFVELEKLKTVYHNLSCLENIENVKTVLVNNDLTIDDMDPNEFLRVVNAFDMPNWNYSNEKKGKLNPLKKINPSKGCINIERFDLVYQRLKRWPGYLKQTTSFNKIDNKLPTIKDLRGRTGQMFNIFGMLTLSKEGIYCLEDKDDILKLDLSECVSNFVIVKGQYCDGQIFKVVNMENPPLECADDTRREFGRIDFLGVSASREDREDEMIKKCEISWKHLFFAIISDVWLDKPETLKNLRKMLRGYQRVKIFPFVFIFIGNFLSESFLYSDECSVKYRAAFDKLGALIAEFPSIAKSSHFIFVPGNNDFNFNGILPQRQISDLYTARLRRKLPNSVFASNPCRIKYCSQELVVFREDIIYKFKRYSVEPSKLQNDQDSLEKKVIKNLLQQSHLNPLSSSLNSIAWDYDHTLRLYPVPDVLILADKYQNYSGFSSSGYKWMVYYPALKKSELW
ncbi:6742_t:CDS:10 [Diversispora eburnea]|uniref:DNA polymerase epsilon subunit n=1 Tax=Diversispora eburnea TaxID=1213867 RepID=A0A9N8VGY3_9GLOM|nr:6742_t:CDS:10 [Diversispora eburnea]